VWLATVAGGFGLAQVLPALWLYGRLGVDAPAWLGDAHRISGRLAFLVSLPVAYHCLWSLGFQDSDARVLAHSLLGCGLYGAFVAKVTIVRSKGLPGIALPIAGGLMLAVLVAAWYTSGLWFIRESGFPDL
jgi:UDP:flavonoid glycosyltransferase YjiC (YdhE family)